MKRRDKMVAQTGSETETTEDTEVYKVRRERKSEVGSENKVS